MAASGFNKQTGRQSTSYQGRARNIVESKRIAMGYTIGQAIAGGKMPEQFYINHKPHNSFDSNGYLKSEAINASDQSGNNDDIIEIDEDQEEQDPYEFMDEEMVDESPATYIPKEVRRKKSSTFVIPSVDDIDNKETTKVTSNIFATSIFSAPKKTSTSDTVKFSFASALDTPKSSELSTATDESDEIIMSKVDNVNSKIINSASNEKPILFGEFGKQSNNIFAPRKPSAMTENVFKFPANVKNTSSETSTNIFSQSNKASIFPTPTEEIEKKNACDRLCEKIYNDILRDVTQETCQSILKTEILTKKKIEDISNRMKKRIVLKYYAIWCRRVKTRKQQRMALENTPVWLPTRSLSECANNLYKKEQNLVIQNMRSKQKTDIDYINDQRNYLVPVEVQIYNGIKKNAERLSIELSSIMYWKMILSWPDLHEKFLLGRYKKIMCEYFSPRDYSIDPIIKTYKPNPYETLNICIKHMDEEIDDNNSVGADGLFFIATTDENPKSVANRLTKTILSRQKLMRIPLVLVILADIESLKMQQFDDQFDEEPAEKKRRIAKENEELPHIIKKHSFYGDDNPENSIMEQSHYQK
ncbi:hypothetical protein PV328_010750 [Microctonus aethiopoides]|uniref:Uncharacterized protein n=1 Tax=Microctonus aethiopoides TaxID=144406 RepID=A0AA39KQH5_9HYME|nr:hypothetical protein PV328_010750 [Microctonus aethiopoides]